MATAKVHDNSFLTAVPNEAKSIAVILLNNSIDSGILDSSSLLPGVLRQSTLTVCADGGANQLFDCATDAQRKLYVPHAIKGDLDSLRSDVHAYYAAENVAIIRDPDQDTNDLEKCLRHVAENLPAADATVVVWGAFGGRFDQEMASFAALFKHENTFDRIVLLDDANFAELLSIGENLVRINSRVMGPICGLIPIGGDVDVWSDGLKWNLNGGRLSFKGLVSSSNEFVKVRKKVLTCGGQEGQGRGGEGGGGDFISISVALTPTFAAALHCNRMKCQ